MDFVVVVKTSCKYSAKASAFHWSLIIGILSCSREYGVEVCCPVSILNRLQYLVGWLVSPRELQVLIQFLSLYAFR